MTVIQAHDTLCDLGILQEVCKYLIGHSLYVSLVCKDWKHCYELAASESELSVNAEQDDDSNSDLEDDRATEERVGALHITLFKAAFASAATVQYAHENHLDLKQAVTRSAGKHGSLEALARVYELDGNWDDALTEGAAARGVYSAYAFADCYRNGRYSA
jgi:hypothetical protein